MITAATAFWKLPALIGDFARRAVVVATMVVVPTLAFADAAQIAREASDLLSQAATSLQKAKSQRDTGRAMAKAIRAYETGLIAANAGLSVLASESQARADALSVEGTRMADIQTALRQIAATPPELRRFHPGGPLAAARAAMLMGDIQSGLAARVSQLQADLDELSTLTALQVAFADDIRQASLELAAARQDLMAGRDVDGSELTDDLGRSSRDLASLATSLDDQSGDAPAPEAAPEGEWNWPVAGSVRRSFGQEDAAGIARPGLIIGAADGALVTAPTHAIVRYTGPFLDAGQVVILSPDPQRMLILTGLQTVFVAPGTRVEPLAPLGLMPGGDTSNEEFLIRFGNGDDAFLNQSLYVEFRKSGIATDPAGLFAPDRQER